MEKNTNKWWNLEDYDWSDTHVNYLTLEEGGDWYRRNLPKPPRPGGGWLTKRARRTN
jgi:hypothetical protein